MNSILKNNKLYQVWNGSTPTVKILFTFLFFILILFLGNFIFLKKPINKNRKLSKQIPSKAIRLQKKNEILSNLNKRTETLKNKFNDLKKGLDTELLSEGALRKGNHIKTIGSIDALLEQVGLLIVKRNQASSTLNKKEKEKSEYANIAIITYNYSLEGDFKRIFSFFSNVNRINDTFKLVNISISKNQDDNNINNNRLFLSFEAEIPFLKYGK